MPRVVQNSLVLSLLIACATGCGKSERKIAESSPAENTSPNAAESAEFMGMLPQIGGPDGYIGSEACRDCHKHQFSSWHRSYHRTMTQFVTEDSVQADFNNVVLTNDTTKFTLSKHNGEFWTRMEPLPHLVPDGERPEPLDVRLGIVTGSHHMQVFWVPEGHGNLQVGFPFTWLIPEKRWVPRNSTFIRPPELEHRPEFWNVVCSRCHTTGVEPHFDARSRTVATQVAELGISCEACHGPAERHVTLRKAAPGASDLEPGEIVQPAELNPLRSSQICGFCHSMKWIDKSEEWTKKGFHYRPGDDLEKTTPIIQPSRQNEIPALAEFLRRSPDILNDFFWSDGMIRVSGREFNGLIESPCFDGGKLSCLSCHSLHESEPDDLLAARGKDNRACTQCHDRFADASTLRAHTHHEPTSSGSQCYNCHMPHTSYGILKAIRSHQISNPSVATELNTGRPNACNLCHLDKTLNWTADRLQEWYNQTAPPLTGAKMYSHAFTLALSGDTGQRALIAWHLGWEPATRTAGGDWRTPVLAHMLEDPYAAVRLIAERSLRGTGMEMPNFDYSVPPARRQAVRDQMWSLWASKLGSEGTKSLPPELPLEPSALVKQKAVFDSLAADRDDRPVRLRE